MKNNDAQQTTREARISPVYEKVFQPGGKGFAGFTILHEDGDFENYVRFFNPKTHAEVLAMVIARHRECAASDQTTLSDE